MRKQSTPLSRDIIKQSNLCNKVKDSDRQPRLGTSETFISSRITQRGKMLANGIRSTVLHI